jgi:hypothetical protein
VGGGNRGAGACLLLPGGRTDALTPSPVFIVGAPRSGTGLLRNLLRSHPHLAFGQETHFLPTFYRAYGNPDSDRAARGLARRILALRWIRSWNLGLDPAALSDHRSYAGLVAAIYEQMARRAGRPRWGDKTPGYVAEIPTLHELFPDAKVVHIYRDGRDVALSWIRARSGPGNVYAAARDWCRLVTIGRRAGEALPPDSYAEVQYEALVSRPEQTMRELCAFLDEPFSEDVLRPTSPPPLDLRRTLRGNQHQPPPASRDKIVSSNAGGWRSAMPAGDRAVVESIAGDLLGELGYETEGLARQVRRGERLSWRLGDRVRRVAVRLNTRPWPETFALMLEARIRERVRT